MNCNENKENQTNEPNESEPEPEPEPVKINPIVYDPEILQKIQDMNYSTELISHLGISQADIDRRMKYYFSIPQPPQKSQAWLNQRTNYITASALENAVSPLWSGKRNDLLRNKVSRGSYNSFHGNEATRWGEKFEDVANAIYCYRQKTKVEEFGLIPHYKTHLLFCGASTDGISGRLINLEIKCPFSRRIKPGTVPHHYWKQMQLQMEVLDLEMTHFLECKFEEYATARDFWIDFDYPMNNPEKGIIIEMIRLDKTNLAGDPKTAYLYSPMHLCESQEALKKWEQDTIKQIITEGSQMIYIRSHYWVIPVCSCVNVARDREWFESKIPDMSAFWDDVEKYRDNGGIEQLNRDIEEHKKIKEREKMAAMGMGHTVDGTCLILDSSESSTGSSTEIEMKKEEGYVIESSSDEDEDEEEQPKDSKHTYIISSDSESESESQTKPDRKFETTATSYIISSSEDEEEEKEKEKEKEEEEEKEKRKIREPIKVEQKTNDYIISSSEDEAEASPVEKITLKLTKINLELTEKKRNSPQAIRDMGVKADDYVRKPTLILTPEHSECSSSLDMEYDGDIEDFSSGSDTDNDSPPLRPPSKKTYRKRKWHQKKQKTPPK